MGSRYRKHSKHSNYIKCRKDEYFDRRTKKCRKKPKGSGMKSKSKRRFKQSMIYNLNNLDNLRTILNQSKSKSKSNSNSNFGLKIPKSVRKDTRIFMIAAHSSICYLDDLEKIISGREPKDLRLDLKKNATIKKYKNLRVINMQNVGRSNIIIVEELLFYLLHTNEKLYSAFLQIDTIESAKSFSKLFGNLLYKLDHPGVKPLLSRFKELYLGKGLTSFNVYPKPHNKEGAQNPINVNLFFNKNKNDEPNLGVFEITKLNSKTGEYDIVNNNRFIKNDDFKDLFEKQHTRIDKKIKTAKNQKEKDKLLLENIETSLMLPDETTDKQLLDLLKKSTVSYTENDITHRMKNLSCDANSYKNKSTKCNKNLILCRKNNKVQIMCENHVQSIKSVYTYWNYIKDINDRELRRMVTLKHIQDMRLKEYTDFQEFVDINEGIFNKIRSNFKKTPINNYINLEEVIKITLERANVKPNEKIVFMDMGCKNITGEIYEKNLVMPSKTKRRSTIKVNPVLLNNRDLYEEGDYPYFFRKLYTSLRDLV